MNRDEKKEPIDSQVLDDKELDSISGGGYYYPVFDCPKGKTKLVEWWLSGTDYSGCNGCESYRQTQRSGWHCDRQSDSRIWE